MNQLTPGLYLVATPIGNMGDISQRAIDVLQNCDVLACEDTRVAKKLLSILEITKPAQAFVALHEHNEHQKSSSVLEHVKSGKIVAYVSDAGMPGVSDPGARLVDVAHAEKIPVTCVPGASAVVTAMALSGFAETPFSFIGFVPRSGKERTKFMNDVVHADDVTIAYESPHRLGTTLRELADHLDDSRRVVVCRELTKKFEEVFRGSAQECAQHFVSEVKGECVIVVEGLRDVAVGNIEADESVAASIRLLVQAGMSQKDVTEVVSLLSSYPKNDIKKMYSNLRS